MSRKSAGGLKPRPITPEINTAIPCPLGVLGGALIWPDIPNSRDGVEVDVLHIGMAPGRDETTAPFQGASGQLLKSWLASTGLLERSGYVNVEQHRTYDLQCRHCKADYWGLDKLNAALDREAPTKTQLKLIAKYPYARECSHEWREIHGNREPRDRDKTGEACGLPLIRRLLAQPRWKIVLCWGGVPARLIGEYKGSVGSMVGRFRTISSGQTCTVLYHPSYLLRQKGTPEYGRTESLEKEILRQVKDRLDHPEGKDRYPYTELRYDAAKHIIGDRSVVDIETTTLGAGPDPRTDPPHTLAVGALWHEEVFLGKISENSRLIVPDNAQLIMHNAQFDLPILYRLTGKENFTSDDTMVMAYLLGEDTLSLKILARRLLGRHAREYKETVGDDAEYGAQDPHLTRELYEYFRPRIDAKGLSFLYDRVKTPLQRIMARHVVRGLKVDHEKIEELRAKMLHRAAVLRQMLFKEAGREFELGKSGMTDEVTSIIFDEFDVPEDRKLGRTTNEVHIGQFRHIPFISNLLAYRKVMSYESRYTGPLSALERVSGLYSLVGTGTDRVAQSNRNCMNFPGLVKACIMADEGGYFVYGDYSQIELRMAVYFSRDPYLMAILKEGRNMHEETCIAIFGARTPETYTKAKSKNFAKLFGAGLRRQARTLGVPLDVVKARDIRWPGWDAWVERRLAEPARTYWGYERNLTDAIESSDEYLRDKAKKQIINSIIQGTAGECTQYAQVLADVNLAQLGGYVIHQEHDSVLGWVPNSIAKEEAIEALMSAMMAAVPQEIKDVIEVKAKVITGDHWG